MCDLHHIRINRLIISLHLVIDYEVMGITEHLNWTKEYWLMLYLVLWSKLVRNIRRQCIELCSFKILNGKRLKSVWKGQICYHSYLLPWYECDSSTSISLHFPKLRLPHTQILRVTLTEMLQPLDRKGLGTRLKHSNSFQYALIKHFSIYSVSDDNSSSSLGVSKAVGISIPIGSAFLIINSVLIVVLYKKCKKPTTENIQVRRYSKTCIRRLSTGNGGVPAQYRLTAWYGFDCSLVRFKIQYCWIRKGIVSAVWCECKELFDSREFHF